MSYKIGHQVSNECRKKISIANTGNKNGMWRDDSVGYISLHEWVKKRIPKPELCQDCGKEPPRDLANKGIYNRDLSNWEWLCRRCHMIKDGRINKLQSFNIPRYKKVTKKCGYCEKIFTVKLSVTKIGQGKYCSKICYNKGR